MSGEYRKDEVDPVPDGDIGRTVQNNFMRLNFWLGFILPLNMMISTGLF